MQNVRILIAYDGSSYHGWAQQPDVPTVQGAVREALRRILATDDVELQGASRTDAGVHAVGQVANFRHDTNRTMWDFVRGLNALTPRDVTIWHAEAIDEDFNARHDSNGKRYRYRIWPHRWEHPLRRGQTWNVRHPIDVDRMRQAARDLVGEHDFTSFRAANCQALTTERKLTRVEVEESDDEFVLWVEGTAFLKYMVRNIAGTLIDVGRGRIEPDAIPEILAARDRGAAGQTAPPWGLTLMEVFYDSHPWERQPRVGVDWRY
jgi:tRNA pseudouridine38-40 synthase